MADEMTLQEAAEKSGVAYLLLRKHAQRNKLKTHRIGSRVMVSLADLEEYLASERLTGATDAIARDRSRNRFRDLGNIIGQLPQEIKDAILEGIPMSGKGGHAGSPEPFRKAFAEWKDQFTMEIRGTYPEVNEEDPHYDFPIGYRHSSRPSWGRVSEGTWELDEATYTWTGFGWEPGGVIAARAMLGEGISPAHPDAGKRPSAPERPKGA